MNKIQLTYQETQKELSKDHKYYVEWADKSRRENELERTIKQINWLVHESGVTQSVISKESGISLSTISRLQLGQQPIHEMKLKNVIKLEKIANKLYK